MVKTITFDQLKTAVENAYTACKDLQGGQNAHYIPYLANVDSSLFGISVCLPDGRVISVGDTAYRLGIESVSKVHTAILALRQQGAQSLLEKIGADATGLPFNSIFAILLENDHPSTPLVNAGAIAACSLVEPVGDADGKWKAIVDNMTDLLGSAPVLIDELYHSESATNFQNRSIAWLLRDYDRLYDDPAMALDLYTRQCSLGVTAEQLAISAATIAAEGRNPVTDKQVFDVVQRARGGVLFIDEAYALVNAESANDFGHEAIEVILKNMEDHRKDLIVIVAGYTDRMEQFIHANPGLESRFNKYFFFEDYDGKQLMEIFRSMCKKNGYTLSEEGEQFMEKDLQGLYEERDENFGNARDVRNLFEQAVARQADRVSQLEAPTKEQLMELKPEDLEENDYGV